MNYEQVVRCPSCRRKDAIERQVGKFRIIACTCIRPNDLKLIDRNGKKVGQIMNICDYVDDSETGDL